MKEYEPGGDLGPMTWTGRVFFVLFIVLFAANMYFFCTLDSQALAFLFGLVAAGCGFAATVAYMERTGR